MHDSAFPEELLSAIESVPIASEYWVGLSGGVDSVLLLVLASQVLKKRRGKTVKAIHVHHGLSKNADEWQSFCEKLARSLDVAITVERVSVSASGEGLEGAARKARYDAYQSHLPEGAVLLQGHHLNDVAETVLYRMMRGAGPKGLAGIPQIRTLKNAEGQSFTLYRPLLSISRSLIEQTANQLALDWVHDESNDAIDFDRNYLRAEILPKLTVRWPDVLGSLAQVAENCREADVLHREVAEADLKSILNYGGLSIAGLQALSMVRQKNVIKNWLDLLGAGYPGRRQFERIWREVIPAGEQSHPTICWSNASLHRYRDRLYCVLASQLSHSLAKSSQVKVEQEIDSSFARIVVSKKSVISPQARELAEHQALSGEGMIRPLSLAQVLGRPVRSTLFANIEDLRLTCRKASPEIKQSDTLSVAGRGSKSLKKIFQEAGVPAWMRDEYPLVCLEGKVVAVPGLAVDQSVAQGPEDKGLDVLFLER